MRGWELLLWCGLDHRRNAWTVLMLACIMLLDVRLNCIARFVAVTLYNLLLAFQLLLQALMHHLLLLCVFISSTSIVRELVAFLWKHFGEELSLIILNHTRGQVSATGNEIFYRSCSRSTATISNQLDTVLVLVHETEYVGESLIHDLVVFLLYKILPTDHAIVSF